MNRHPNANNLRERPQITQPADPSYRIIALTQGQVTTVDTGDYDWLMQWHWYAWWNKNGRCFYAVRTMTLAEDPGPWAASTCTAPSPDDQMRHMSIMRIKIL